MLVFAGMTQLDFAGPLEVLARMPGAQVHVLGKERAPVLTDIGQAVLPQLALAEAPVLDMLFVGGGPGATALMEDAQVLDFLRERAPAAQWITSVCTGALVLGAAGLLRGYRATTHWTALEVLALLGAEPVRERVVVDRNRITGGGVTAGIDFGLTVAAQLHGEAVAKGLQLGMEYDPRPPFDCGSPATAPAGLVTQVRERAASMTEARIAAATRIRAA
ncbi:MAG TPA: DJ-1/PfpI family protein [Burkholderiaceae bacterium]|nr:DJ-1/PfpI family protein [Burkholderiaceae bacterium]